ncbi:MAG: hypothetical protein ACK51P_05820 [Microcystis sp.]|uniref:hypothetical protein n=1 Tax=Microcystis sp. TaxID=1127 RepID=UPI00391FC0C7
MNPLVNYFRNLHEIHSSQAAVKETSYYGTLETLLNEIGKTLKPQVGFHASNQPCILREVVDRPNLGQKRPLRSKGHHHNLPDKTRTVAGVVAKTINC